MTESDSDSSHTLERDINIKQLINEVKQRPAIWQKKEAINDYRLAQKSWTEIAEIFGVVHVDALKRKWRNLRDSFFRKHKAVIRSENPLNSKQKWRYYSSLLFLNNWNVNSSKNNSSENSVGLFENDSNDNKPANMSLISHNLEAEKCQRAEEKEKSRKRSISGLLDSFQKDLIDLEKTKMARLTADDQDDDLLFFRSLLPYVKSLDLQRKMVLRTKIQQMVTDFIFHTPNQYIP